MSSHSDGADGVINHIPTIISIFKKEGWLISELLTIQESRIKELLRDINNGQITVSSGHYNDLSELIKEVLANFSVLRDL